jgi:hypothetical protein
VTLAEVDAEPADLFSFFWRLYRFHHRFGTGSRGHFGGGADQRLLEWILFDAAAEGR